jgi:hypothetical protein
MKTTRFTAQVARCTQAFDGPFRRPTSGRIRNALTALVLGLAAAWVLVHALCT